MLPEDRVSLADPSGVSQVEVDSNQFFEVGQLRMCNPRLERLLAIANSNLGCLQQSNSRPKEPDGWDFARSISKQIVCLRLLHAGSRIVMLF